MNITNVKPTQPETRFTNARIRISNRLGRPYRMAGRAAFLILMLLAAAQTAHAQFGIAAGANFEELGTLDGTDSRAAFDRATGYHVGMFFNLGAGRISVQPGVYLRDFGDVKLVEQGRFRTLSLILIEVPVDLRIRLVKSGPISPVVLAGPVVGFATTEDESFQDSLRELTVSANVGGGFELQLPGSGLTIIPEVRFARSIIRFFEDGHSFDIAGVDFTPVEVSRQDALMLRLGLRF